MLTKKDLNHLSMGLINELSVESNCSAVNKKKPSPFILCPLSLTDSVVLSSFASCKRNSTAAESEKSNGQKVVAGKIHEKRKTKL